MPATPRLLLLHGFASDPRAPLAAAITDHLAARGAAVTGLDLRVPSLEHLRVSAMIERVQDAIGAPQDRAVLIGLSLGGLVAARVAERDPRVSGVVLLAPAFRAMERWRRRIGEDAWAGWQRTGWLRIHDETARRPARVDFGFAEDLIAIDADGEGWPDVRVPTLILHGRRDDLIHVELSRQFARSRPHVKLVELDDGHEMSASLPTVLAETDTFLSLWIGPALAAAIRRVRTDRMPRLAWP